MSLDFEDAGWKATREGYRRKLDLLAARGDAHLAVLTQDLLYMLDELDELDVLRANIAKPLAAARPITQRVAVMGGSACIDGTAVQTRAIAQRFRLGESIAAIARDFEITQVEVVLALRHEMQHEPGTDARSMLDALARLEGTLQQIGQRLAELKPAVIEPVK